MKLKRSRRNRLLPIGVALVTALGVVTSTSPVSASPPTAPEPTIESGAAEDKTRLQNRYSGKCLAIWSGTDYNGQPAIEAACNPNYRDQFWVFEYAYTTGAGNNVYSLRNDLHRDKCLAISSENVFDGAPAFQYTCSGHSDQQWIDHDDGTGHHLLRNVWANRCVAFRAGDPGPRNARIFGCDPTYRDQQWYVLDLW